ncbi:hypothetical protein L3Q82_021229, partial [Scortum barcoo]
QRGAGPVRSKEPQVLSRSISRPFVSPVIRVQVNMMMVMMMTVEVEVAVMMAPARTRRVTVVSSAGEGERKKRGEGKKEKRKRGRLKKVAEKCTKQRGKRGEREGNNSESSPGLVSVRIIGVIIRSGGRITVRSAGRLRAPLGGEREEAARYNAARVTSSCTPPPPPPPPPHPPLLTPPFPSSAFSDTWFATRSSLYGITFWNTSARGPSYRPHMGVFFFFYFFSLSLTHSLMDWIG